MDEVSAPRTRNSRLPIERDPQGVGRVKWARVARNRHGSIADMTKSFGSLSQSLLLPPIPNLLDNNNEMNKAKNKTQVRSKELIVQ